MPLEDPSELLRKETRVALGAVPHGLSGGTLDQDCWQLDADEFLLRNGASHYFHYRKGKGVTIERGEGADVSGEALWLGGSVYSAAACINGFMPIHASAVCHGGKVYAFTGASGAGKSTLVTALAARGLALFCDDTLVLDLTDPDRLLCLPGHKRLKLTPEALGLTDAEKQEKVGKGIDKYYAAPARTYSGPPLALAKLVFLEIGANFAIGEITGAKRMSRLADDHYTAQHFAAARQFGPAEQFAHLARLANQIAMARFERPCDIAQFNAGVDLVQAYIEADTRQPR